MKHKSKRPKIALSLMLCLCILVCSLLMVAADNNHIDQVMELMITIQRPGGQLTGAVDINVKVDVLSSSANRIIKVEARTDPTEAWTDITSNLRVTITKSCTVYVQVTDSIGNKYFKSRFIDYYSNVEPQPSPTPIPTPTPTPTRIPTPTPAPVQAWIPTSTPVPTPAPPEQVPADINICPTCGKNIAYNSVNQICECNQAAQSNQAGLYNRSNNSGIPVDGNGSLIENSIKSSEQREFFTITTKKGNEFFIVVDREKTENNVYLLVQASERDLLGFVDDGEQASKSSDTEEKKEPFYSFIKEPKQTDAVETTPTPTPAEQPKSKKNTGVGNTLILLLVVVGVGGAGYYFKIYKPKNQDISEMDEDDEEEDEDLDYSESTEPNYEDASEDKDFVFEDDE